MEPMGTALTTGRAAACRLAEQMDSTLKLEEPGVRVLGFKVGFRV